MNYLKHLLAIKWVGIGIKVVGVVLLLVGVGTALAASGVIGQHDATAAPAKRPRINNTLVHGGRAAGRV